MRRRTALRVLVAFIAAAALIAAFHNVIAGAIVTAAFDRVTHMRISFASLRLGTSAASFSNLRIRSAGGEPIGTISRLEVRYDLRDLVFGGGRKYGLRSIAIDRPALELIRNADGTFNVPVPRLGKGTSGGAPFVFSARIRDGSIAFVDRTQSGAHVHPMSVADARLDATVDTAARTTYAFNANYVDRGRTFPIRARGLIQASRLDLQHVWAARLPIADLANFALHGAALRMDAGELVGLDVRVFGVAAPGMPLQPHVFGGARLTGGRISAAALTAPIAGVHGTFAIAQDAIVTDGISARAGALDATVRGGMYDLSRPQARFTLATRARLSRIRGLLRAAAHLPAVSGPVAVRVLVEGALLRPRALVSIDSPHLAYNGVVFADTNLLLGASARGIDVLHASTAYGGTHVSAMGNVGLRPVSLRLLIRGSSLASSLPYVDGILPGMVLHATALATAANLHRIELSGFIAGTTRSQRASTLFAVSSRGVGTVGPLFMGNGRHWLSARIAIDHPRARIAAIAVAHDFAIAPSPPVPLGNFRISKIPLVAGEVSGAIVGAQNGRDIVARVRDGAFASRGAPWIAHLDATVAVRNGAVDVSPASARVLGGSAYAAGGLHGTGGRLAVLISGAHFKGLAFGGAGFLAMHGRTLRIDDVLLDAAGAVVTGQGSVAMNGSHPYAIAGRVRDLDLHTAASVVNPRLAQDVRGEADANVAVRGTGASPAIDGSVAVPEDSIDGQGFTALAFRLRGGSAGVALDRGLVTVGSSRLNFHGAVSAGASRVAIAAPHVDLADFNDLFNTGDMLAGRGSVALTLATGTGLRTSGSVHLTGARLRQYDLGTTSASWSTTGTVVRLRARAASPTGRFEIAGSVVPPATFASGTVTAARSTYLDLSLRAHDVSLGSWAPPLSLRAPVVGTASASATVRGRYPSLAIAATATVDRAMAGRVPIRHLAFSGTLRGTHGDIRSLTLSMPYLSASASGVFGLSKTAPFDLQARAQSPNVGLLAATTTGRKNPLAGSLSANARLRGTMIDPQIAATIDMRALRYRRFTLPRVAARVTVNRKWIALSGGEADFAQGRVLASGHVPIRARARGARVAGGAPIAARVVAQSVALENFAPFLPSGTQLGGTLSGTIDVAGWTTAPVLRGTVRLSGGAYHGPLDKAPLDHISGAVVLSQRRILLQGLRARAGAGSIAGSGTILLPSLLSPRDAALAFTLQAAHATFDSPKYFSGQVDGRVGSTYSRRKPIALRGTVAVSHATIPVSALYRPSGSQSKPHLPPVAFHLAIRAGPDVAIKNSVVNVGGAGDALLTGTLAHPVMAGVFHATGGTVNFYQLFRVQRAVVSFSPGSGITPYVDAVATTIVAQPPTTIHIHVTGPATSMQLALHSMPHYSRSQILGLLVGMQSFGAVQGVPQPTGTPFTVSSVVQRVGFGEANRIFTQSILNPIATTLGGALGTRNLQLYSNIGSGYGTGIGASLVKRIAQYVTMSTSANFGYPRREMLAIRYERTAASNAVLEFFEQQQSFLNSTPPGLQQGPSNLGLIASNEMINAQSSGIVLRLERRYWSCGLFHYCLSCSRC